MTHTAPAAPATHLQTVADHWADLRDQLDTPTVATWPPSGLQAYLAALDDDARAQYAADAAAERAERNTDALGESPAPLNPRVYETVRAVEMALVGLADQIASRVQRPLLLPQNTRRGWSDDLHRFVLMAAAKDAADTRRWRYSGDRNAVDAARWLLGRLKAGNGPLRPQDGPFRPLTPAQHRHIAAVAEEAAARVEKALGIARRDDVLKRPCPRCGEELTLHHGGGKTPEVTCKGGCSPWAGPRLASLLVQLEQASAE